MDFEVIKEFIKIELLILIPVLYFLGVMIKNTLIIKDKYIPLILGLIGITLCIIWVLATEKFMTMQDIFMAIFVSITQGILVAGASVYVNQLVKQAKKAE